MRDNPLPVSVGGSDVLVRDDILMALVPPIGPRPGWASLLAFLKLARGTVLNVARSELEFIDAVGRSLETRVNAFGLAEGTHLVGSYSERFGDDSRRPKEAVLALWRLNGLSVTTALVIPAAEWRVPRVAYLPLQVPLPNDYHMIVSIVNLGTDPINIADGMREAVCWVDGVSYESVAARVWNGEYLVRPNRTTTRRFHLSDFPGAPRHGTHETSLEILGARSVPSRVSWRGQPWQESMSGL